jgi:hypothetical protein
MPTYVYCLLTPTDDAPPDDLRGVDGAPVRVVRAGSVDAWVSEIVSRSPAPSVEGARMHDAVVRQALGRQTPLPARFGQTFASDAELIASVRRREETFVCALERVRGAVEMTVRVLAVETVTDARPESAQAATAVTTGRAYLERLRERHVRTRAWEQEAEFLLRRVAAAVRGLVRAEVRAVATQPARSLSISHLVNHDSVSLYRESLGALADTVAGSRVVISGPWPPYSFAEIGRV